MKDLNFQEDSSLWLPIIANQLWVRGYVYINVIFKRVASRFEFVLHYQAHFGFFKTPLEAISSSHNLSIV